MKLELKHLAPYLPYGVKFERPYLIYSCGEDPQPDHEEWGEDELTIKNAQMVIDCGFPLLLLPLSQLENHPNWAHCSSYKVFIVEIKMETVKYSKFHSLCKDHFDVFGLIEAGLAIDKSTIK